MYLIQWVGPMTWRFSPTETSTVNGSPAFTEAGAVMTGAKLFSRGVFAARFLILFVSSKSDLSTFVGKNFSAAPAVPAQPATTGVDQECPSVHLSPPWHRHRAVTVNYLHKSSVPEVKVNDGERGVNLMEIGHHCSGQWALHAVEFGR